ncbi:phospholipase D-like domain-containing protein [Stigmatella hybrida]|uniref:phospholipase D-like domain-containing protein n=1 Tax=Stigmatella hybrida TaxID=394097 RepID=UPI001CDAF331|nr:phospholipase D-like domain-containing protein [Stigmatella hybrida]
MALHFLNTDETIRRIVALIRNARREAWLVSPYVTTLKDDQINQAIRAALRRGVTVNLVFRLDDRGQLSRTFRDEQVAELEELGLRVLTVAYLHAKLYWSDFAVVVTSLNMVETTFDKIIDVGLWSDDPKDIANARRFFEVEIRPNIFELDEVIERVEEAMGDDDDEEDDEDDGVCIRCGEDIDFDPGKPYCLDDYRKWARYGDEDYEDNYCHGCGDEYPATMRKPLCRDCYR